MEVYKTSPAAMFSSLWRNRRLIWQLVIRDVVGRYKGSMLGVLWSFFNPLLMLIVYTFVFSVVFKARWDNVSSSKTEFATVLFAGMIVFAVFSECITRAPSQILASANYVKKVIFPLETLPVIGLGVALFHAVISLCVLLLFIFFAKGAIPWTVAFLPLVLLPLILLTLGLGWFLSSLGVYLRDVSQTVGIFTTALMFLSPVFYPISALPEKYQSILRLNPLTWIIEETRNVAIWGKLPDWEVLTTTTSLTMLIACFGFAWFQKARRGFADVM